MRAQSLLVAAMGLVLVMACGKSEPKGTLPQDTPAAIKYYQQFNFDKGFSVPSVSGGAQYAQSPQVRLNVDGNFHSKLDLFLLDDNTFALEYTEINAKTETPVKGKVNGVVITGNYFVKDTNLILKTTDGKDVAQGSAEITSTGQASIALSMKGSLRDFKSDLKAEKLSDKLYFTYNRTSRVLPSDLKSGLASEMAARAADSTDGDFKN